MFEYPDTDSFDTMFAAANASLLTSNGTRSDQLFYPQFVLTEDVDLVLAGVLDPTNYAHTLQQLSRKVSSRLPDILDSSIVRRSQLNVLFADMAQEAGTVELAQQVAL